MRLEKYHRIEDVKYSLVTELLIRTIIITKLKLKNNEIRFGYNTYGKPYLFQRSKFSFNVSHSGSWVICGIDSEPLGVDIEKIIPIGMEVPKKFFSDIEYKSIIELQGGERVHNFFDLWTLK